MLNLRGRNQEGRLADMESRYMDAVKADPEYAKDPESVTKKYDEQLIQEVVEATKDYKLAKDSGLVVINTKKFLVFQKSHTDREIFFFFCSRTCERYT